MMDCHELAFSPLRAQLRIEKALLVFPKAFLFKLLAFSLYLLGAQLRELSALFGFPEESIRTYARVACRDGFQALVDRRRTDASSAPLAEHPEPARPSVLVDDGCLVVALDSVSGEIRIPSSHKVQSRTVLLTLLNSGLLSLQDVATASGLSPKTCSHLAHKLQDNDVDQALVDKRQGQTQDYRVGPDQKAELIQQFAARAVTGHSTASEDLTEAVGQATGVTFSPRTIRWHVGRLGLNKIRDSLPELVTSLKKKLLILLHEANVQLSQAVQSRELRRELALCIVRAPAEGPQRAPTTVLSAAMSERISCRQAIVALNQSGVEASATACLLNCSVDVVYFWLHRHTETTNDLNDRPRSGRPPLYADTDKLRIIAFYCQTQPLPGCGRWTFRWAQVHLKASPDLVGSTPGKSTIHRILNENGLKPHQSAYFLHITDPNFFPKMEHLLNLYSYPPSLLFFFDECPGIQLLKRLAPHLQTDEVKKRLAEFEYIRNGTMDVFAFLEHSTGKVYAECHGDHTTSTFLTVFRRHVLRLPTDQTLHYVMDNLSTHCSYSFCQVVAEFSGVECPPEAELDKPDKREAWLQTGEKRIVIHFTPCHGSWLNLVEIWFRILNHAVLKESFGSPEAFKEAFDAFDEAWNTLLAHPFRWSYDGKGLQEKAVKRFTTMLETSAEALDTRFLTKSLQLMTNLLEQYFSEVSEETWNHLVQAATSKHEILEGLIRKEEGPQRKKKAEQSLSAFTEALNELLLQDQRQAA